MRCELRGLRVRFERESCGAGICAGGGGKLRVMSVVSKGEKEARDRHV